MFLVAQDGARRAFCVCSRGKHRKSREKGREKGTAALTAAAQPFSLPHLLRLLSGPFLVYSLRCKQGPASLCVRGLQVKTKVIAFVGIPSDSPHLLVYQSRARQGLISSATQNAARVIALCVKTQPVATWLVYTRGCSNNVVLWQAATTIFSPLFIHLLSHLALLAILALTLNQIYHAVRTVSVFILFSVALLLFFLI